MIQQRWLGTACLALTVVSCSPPMVDPVLEVTVQPRTIRADGQSTTISLNAIDGTGKPGTGQVRVRAAAGSLREASTVALAAGKGELSFTCASAMDGDCRGTIRITAEWNTNMRLVEGGTSVTVTAVVPDAGGPMDAGVDAGAPMDAGVDAGAVDGGPDAGDVLPPEMFDGGFSGAYKLSVVDVEKPTILSGVMDEVDVTFRLTTNTSAMLPVAGRMATITVDQGASFDPVMSQSSTTRMTDANGRFVVTVSPGSASRTVLRIIANAEDARVTALVRAVDVGSVEWAMDTMTRTTLAVISNGQATNTPVFFRLRDANNNPVEGVDVDFSVAPNSAAGCMVLPTRDRSNAMGLVRTQLTAGDSQGTATVIARVTGVAPTPSTQFNIVIGRVSEGRMALSCARTTLGAMQVAMPPRNDQNTNCTVTLADRNGLNPPFALNVSWLTEAGNMPSQVMSTAGSNSVSSMFNTGGALPVATSPLPAVSGAFPAPAEPSAAANNPRDNFVTIVAAVQGEEQFWDGSGTSGGLANGGWDPGEYWVDLAEPFADSNDNGTWDPNEPFIDTDRVNCTTGLVEAKNSRWDPPNGCWDRNTQVWKPTHVVYSGGPVTSPGATPTFLRFSPPIPSSMPNDTTQQVQISWTDAWFNRFSSDSASITVSTIAGSRGQATIGSSTISGEEFGHTLQYFAMRAQVSDAGVVLAEEGVCDPLIPDSGFPAVRCLRTYRFRDWRTSPPTVTMTLVSPTPQALLSDGGVPPPTSTTWELRAQNQLQSGPSTYQFNVSFP
ncbi:MAG: Ig-like domain-containing protein [Myxococcaceae bacterium]|nr:Ig-like domain-containing protein [Myxococcaceae bacterium]